MPYKCSNCESHSYCLLRKMKWGFFFYNAMPICGKARVLLGSISNIKFSQNFTGQSGSSPCIHHVLPPSGLPPPPKSVDPSQYSPCHSPSQSLYSPGPHTAAWVLGEHVQSPLSCHCAQQCQTLSGKGPGPQPCCYF